MKVKRVEIIEHQSDFCDIGVDGTHNYFVTERNINVHNSGKSFVVNRTTGGLNLKIINSDNAFERGLKRAYLSLNIDEMSPEEYEKAMEIRAGAKNVTKVKEDLAVMGRLGLILDGTGKDFEKIQRQSEKLKSIGYDTYMIFVNTSLEVALQRNTERKRTVPEHIVRQSWQEVQQNMGKFQNHFGQDKFIIVDNNNATEDVLLKVWKRIAKVIDRPVENHVAKKWIQQQLDMKRRG